MHARRKILTTTALAASLLGLGLGLGLTPQAQAQDNTLRLVVPYPAGGSSDRATRILAEALQNRTGQTVVVDNVTGAGGRVAMQQVKRMPDNAQVLVVVNPALMVVAPLVFSNIGYDPEKDFQPVSQVSTYEFAAAVAGAVPVREFSHLAAWMRANPEKASFGVPASGSLPHFFALMLNQSTGTQAPVVGYRGSAPLLNDLMGNHIPVAIDTLDSLMPQHEGGKLRILATSGSQRAVPGIPTFKEAGFKVTASGWNTLYAKSTMPADKVAKLAEDIRAIMAQPKIREQFVMVKAEPVSSSLAQTRKDLASFKAQWVPVIQQANLKFN